MFARAVVVAVFTLAAPSSSAQAIQHDELNRITQINLGSGRSIAYDHDAAGNIRSIRRISPSVDPALVGWWTFDDCTARDASGFGNDGVVGFGLACVAGWSGNAIRFAASGATVKIPSSASLKIDWQMTISILAKLDPSCPPGAGLLEKGSSNVIWDYGMVQYGGAPAYRSSATDWVLPSPPDFSGVYHLFTTIIDEQDTEQPIKIYVDGSQLSGDVRSINGIDPRLEQYRLALISQSDLEIVLGVGHPGAGAWLIGDIDDVRIHN